MRHKKTELIRVLARQKRLINMLWVIFYKQKKFSTNLSKWRQGTMPELGGLMTFLTKNLNQKSFVLNLQAKKTLKVLKLNFKKLWNQIRLIFPANHEQNHRLLQKIGLNQDWCISCNFMSCFFIVDECSQSGWSIYKIIIFGW